jgi:flagellar basal-body rod modification protein FlgD
MGNSVSSVVGGNGTTSSSGASSANGVIGKDAFLKMLTTQLKYQDPLNPMEGTDFATQLAQFSSVEQLSNMNTTLTASVDANSLLTQSITNSLSTTLIGKSVRATGSKLTYDGSTPVNFGYNLASGATKVRVGVYNSGGVLLKTVTADTDKFDPLAAGNIDLSWDGTDESGKHVEKGTYTFKVEAFDADNKPMSSSSYTYGTIGSVRFKSSGTYFMVDGKEISLSDVLEILQGKL